MYPVLDIYVDGADEINPQKMMIKGGGAALTREKNCGRFSKKIYLYRGF